MQSRYVHSYGSRQFHVVYKTVPYVHADRVVQSIKQHSPDIQHVVSSRANCTTQFRVIF